jgi:hypothetical protein
VTEVVAPPDTENAYIAYLKAEFASRSETARVSTSVPKVRPSRMVRASLIGTTRPTRGHFYSRLLVECWAPTEPEAAALALLAYALTGALEGETAGTVFIADVTTVGGPANHPEPDIGPRYQFTVDLLVDGEVI